MLRWSDFVEPFATGKLVIAVQTHGAVNISMGVLLKLWNSDRGLKAIEPQLA